MSAFVEAHVHGKCYVKGCTEASGPVRNKFPARRLQEKLKLSETDVLEAKEGSGGRKQCVLELPWTACLTSPENS